MLNFVLLQFCSVLSEKPNPCARICVHMDGRTHTQAHTFRLVLFCWYACVCVGEHAPLYRWLCEGDYNYKCIRSRRACLHVYVCVRARSNSCLCVCADVYAYVDVCATVCATVCMCVFVYISVYEHCTFCIREFGSSLCVSSIVLHPCGEWWYVCSAQTSLLNTSRKLAKGIPMQWTRKR